MWILDFVSKLFKKRQGIPDANSHTNTSNELFNTFDKDNHLQPFFEKSLFDTLHSWDLGWAILEPMNIVKSKDDEIILAKRFSPGQKALWCYWYLDGQVTNGGFIQFYWNGFAKYLPAIIDGLKLIGDNQTIELIEKADKAFKSNIKFFIDQKNKDDWGPLYENLKIFDDLDAIYYATHDKTMELIESYARQHPGEFVKFI